MTVSVEVRREIVEGDGGGGGTEGDGVEGGHSWGEGRKGDGGNWRAVMEVDHP
jgi:hypothetical protein